MNKVSQKHYSFKLKLGLQTLRVSAIVMETSDHFDISKLIVLQTNLIFNPEYRKTIQLITNLANKDLRVY